MATNLKSLASYAKRANKLQSAADAALAVRDAAIVDVRAGEQPPTYQQIADAVGLTKDRVNQIIQKASKS